MLERLKNLFRLRATSNKKPLHNIGCPYRVNRIIRSKYKIGDYEVVNRALHHYAFEIDGRRVVLSIVEVLSAIEVLQKFEAKESL